MLNNLIKQANELLKNCGIGYAFWGGWAIDLFIGAETRKHGDIDILLRITTLTQEAVSKKQQDDVFLSKI